MFEKRGDRLSENAKKQDREWKSFIGTIRLHPQITFDKHLSRFFEIYRDRSPEDGPPQIWQPDPEQSNRSNLFRLMQKLNLNSYEDLHTWSVENRPAFWDMVVKELGIAMARNPRIIYDGRDGVENCLWLPEAQLNIVDSCFQAPPHHPALVLGREETPQFEIITYDSLQRMTNRFANGLRNHGFKEGDCIALYMPMNFECVAAYLGTIRAGCCVVSIADSFQPPEVKKRLDLSQSKAVVTVSSFRRGGKAFQLYEKAKKAEAPTAVVLPPAENERVELRAADLSWNDFLGDAETFDSVVADPYRTTNILFSSGTTGTPKAIPWTHLTPIKCAMDGRYHQDIRTSDRVCWPTNIGWMMGPWLVYATLINGATAALYEGAPHQHGFIRFVQNAGVTILGVIPSLVKAWRSERASDESNWCGIRLFSSTGEPSNQEDYLWLMSQSRYKAPVIEYCGGTEIGGGYITGSVLQPASPATFTTPALGLDFVLFDARGKEVIQGDMGEVFLVPPSIGLSQKLLNKDHHEEYYAGCPVGSEGAVLRRHGDQIYKMARNFYKAQGRADDTMNLGGIKVAAPEIESIVNAHDAVYESAAVSIQQGGEGREQLVLFVVLNKGRDEAQLLTELNQLIAAKLNPLFKIFKLVITRELAKTASHKVMRRELRRQYLEKPD
jgi:acetyl-CoA synthetase